MCPQCCEGAQYRGGVQYRGGYLDYCGECSLPWGISLVPWGYPEYYGDILSTIGDVQYWGEYRDTCRGYYDIRRGIS